MRHIECMTALSLMVVLALGARSRGDEPTFIRGDANATGGIDITDAVVIFNFLFLGHPLQLPCDDAADVDDRGDILITDGVFLLNYSFLGGPRPPSPGPESCGIDPTEDRFRCERFDPCFGIGPQRCGGITGGGCSPGEFCEFPAGTCDVVDIEGECVAIPGPCPEFFDPVCGCDGVTYSNDCFRQAAGVSKDHDGRCGSAVCGGIQGLPCDEGEFCDLPAGSCGAADLEGECVPVPMGCPRIFDPVCGCDGVTYSNDCVRQAAGVSKAHDGECGGRMCDGFAGLPCEPGEFCEHPAGTCDLADGAGVCTPIPTACPDNLDPVCGCDGRTYSNDCDRQAAGVSKAHDGPCPE